MGDGAEPIDDDEILYRRIPHLHYDSAFGWPTPEAFKPRHDDLTGLSFCRAKYTTPIEEARKGQGKQYYIAALRAGDLREHGLDVTPKPLSNDPGHCEMPVLNYQERKTKRAEEAKLLLARKLCLRVLGPLP